MIPALAKLSRPFFGTGVILLLLSFCAMASARSTWFTRVWQIDDGLLDNEVDGIVQSADNYLWLVTPIGLMQFDGQSFYPFPIEDFVRPQASHVRVILCSRTGVLWMASDGGTIFGLNPDFSVTPIPRNNLPSRVPSSLAEDKDGALWLGYHNSVYRFKNGRAIELTGREGVPSGPFHSLTSDGAGNIWLAKGDDIGFFKDGKFLRIATESNIQCLGASRTNAVWLVAGINLFACDTGGKLRNYGAIPCHPGTSTAALLEDDSGSVWIGTTGAGLFHYDESGFETVYTSHPSILSLAQDREGDIWVGTSGGGLDRITLNGIQMEVMQNNQALPEMLSACQDSKGVLWGVTQNGILVSKKNGQWNPVFTNAPFDRAMTCVAAEGDTLWAGTKNGEIIHLVGAGNPGSPTNVTYGAILGILPASNGDLWIVGLNTLQRLHQGQMQNINLPRQLRRIFAIAEDANRNIWIGGNGMVMVFDGQNLINKTSQLQISGRPICCLYGTPDGSMWIGSRGGGLIRYKNGRAGQIGEDRGLFSNYLSQIVRDQYGWMWFGSIRGVFKVRQQEIEQAMDDRGLDLRPIIYGSNEGLKSEEAVFSVAWPYVFPQAFLDRTGRVWMLMRTGVVVADPRILPAASTPPPVLLTQVLADEQTVASYAGVASVKLKGLNAPLQLLPSHRHLEFDFTAFHFIAPENIHFRYQLVGFDTNWIDAGTERSATYSRLPAGNYQFCVSACVGDGPWSDAPATLNLVVTPFFWQTWWFRLGSLLLSVSIVIVVVRYISISRIRTQMRLLEQRAALDKERTRIARDLHDDLGCSLNKVALTLDMMQNEPAMPKSKNEEIQHCCAMVRDVAQSVDEIVWAINPRNDTLHYMIDYISQSAVEFLQAADIPCIIALPDHIPNQMISPEIRHHLLLVVKEALNNVARHSKATEVRLNITAARNEITIEIEDNGRGFEHVPDNASSDGLRNMRERMEEIGGEFQLRTRPGSGTCVTFHYIWSPQTLN